MSIAFHEVRFSDMVAEKYCDSAFIYERTAQKSMYADGTVKIIWLNCGNKPLIGFERRNRDSRPS